MTVQEMIDALTKIQDRNKEVWIMYDSGYGQMPVVAVTEYSTSVSIKDWSTMQEESK
jgi:hypothetical protein